MTVTPRSPAAHASGDGIAAVGLRLWQARLAPAQAMVRSSKWTREESDAKLKPWASIAILCWAQVFEAQLTLGRQAVVFYRGDGSFAEYDHVFEEGEARANLARDLCPRAEWEPVLSQATAAAIDAYEANRNAQSEQAARDLLAACRALDVIPAATRLVHVQPERIAA